MTIFFEVMAALKRAFGVGGGSIAASLIVTVAHFTWS